jgi:integrase
MCQNEEKLKIGRTVYRDDGLVFATVTGTKLDPNNITRAFDRRVKAAELRRIRFHDCRHTAATLMLADGTPLKVASERLGHADVGTTANRYMHTLEQMQRDAAARLGDALLGP